MILDWFIGHPVVAALLVLATLSLVFGAILGFAAVKYKVEGDPLVEQVDNLLPQTQCGQCGHPGCRPYAQAIVNNGEAINHCPPGGQATINALADLLGVEAPALDAEHGESSDVKKVALIREEDCIGCTKCIQACPVDAIIGAQKKMHTVIASECTGCDLCIEPCPVDCIDLVPVAPTPQEWVWEKPELQLIATDKQPAPEVAV